MRHRIRPLTAADQASLEKFLQPRMEVSMFLIGNSRISGLEYNGEPYSGNYAAIVDEKDAFLAVAAHFWNDNLIVSAPVGAADLCLKLVKYSGRPVRGIIGPAIQVEKINNALKPDLDLVQLDQTEKLYTLQLDDLQIPPAITNELFSWRRINKADLELMVQWRVDYCMEALGSEDSVDLWNESRGSVERSFNEGRCWVLEKEGKPVSTSSFNTAIAEAVQIGGVWTPPQWRNRGYGRAAVAASLMDVKKEGVRQSILFTGTENIAAQRSYEAIGYRHTGDYRLLLFKNKLQV